MNPETTQTLTPTSERLAPQALADFLGLSREDAYPHMVCAGFKDLLNISITLGGVPPEVIAGLETMVQDFKANPDHLPQDFLKIAPDQDFKSEREKVCFTSHFRAVEAVLGLYEQLKENDAITAAAAAAFDASPAEQSA